MIPLTLVRDSRVFSGHDWPGHPESAQRLDAIEAKLQSEDDLAALPSASSRTADVDAVRLVHSDDHVARIESLARHGGGWIDADTYCTARSYDIALRAVGASVEAARAVATRAARHAYAIVRPPGHHATPTTAMGFCLFNNVAVAARWLQREHGVGRLAILDIDVHHGNGTQDVFYGDPDVLYVSLHQWPWYPGTGREGDRGAGAGIGATLNLPLPAGTDGVRWLEALDATAIPALEAHRPEIVLVSAGFDAHEADPLAGLRLATETYGAVAERVVALAAATGAAGSVWFLEGGYDLEAMPASLAATLRALAADPAA